MKKAIVSVTNDLSTDQRVHKVCLFLVNNGYDVTLVGRLQGKSSPMDERPYKTRRLRIGVEKGALFYAVFNVRLFFYLLFNKATLLVANDLDTLLPNYLISGIKGIPLVYDSHEYFCGVPELINRPLVKGIWHTIEKAIFPVLKHVYTVNESIAKLYRDEYNVEIGVVRNAPYYTPTIIPVNRTALNLPENIPLIIYQGAGINIDRGAEEAVLAMEFVPNAILLIIGSGDVIEHLKETSAKKELKDKIIFLPKMPFDLLKNYTMQASIGLTLDKDTSPNYRYSLPNKLFDYIHANVPVLASPLIEVKRIVEQYNIGEFIENHDPKHIANKINSMLADKDQLNIWKANCVIASKDLNWQKEENELLKIYAKVKGFNDK